MLTDRVANTALTGLAVFGAVAMAIVIFIVVAGPYLQRRSNEYDNSINAKNNEKNS